MLDDDSDSGGGDYAYSVSAYCGTDCCFMPCFASLAFLVEVWYIM